MIFDEYEHDQAESVRLLVSMRGEFFRRQSGYSVIVECYQKAKAGRVKRAWLKEFSEAERKTIGRWYAKFYRWEMVEGAPNKVLCKPSTLELIQRAANFFAANF